jgi:hypothetical protein
MGDGNDQLGAGQFENKLLTAVVGIMLTGDFCF